MQSIALLMLSWGEIIGTALRTAHPHESRKGQHLDTVWSIVCDHEANHLVAFKMDLLERDMACFGNLTQTKMVAITTKTCPGRPTIHRRRARRTTTQIVSDTHQLPLQRRPCHQ